MKNFKNIRTYAWIEFAIWLLIVSVCVLGIRYCNYNNQKHYKSYQIFINDADGLIVGSPVKFLGVQIGHVTKIKIISSNVYIKFVITQPNLELPRGVITTVEGSGLGGSKALEIYPPSGIEKSNMLIVSKDPTRLGKVMGLFNDIFRQLDEIITNVVNASDDLDLKNQIPEEFVVPDEYNTGFYKFDQSIDYFHQGEKNFRKQFNLDNWEKRDEFEIKPEQSESDR